MVRDRCAVCVVARDESIVVLSFVRRGCWTRCVEVVDDAPTAPSSIRDSIIDPTSSSTAPHDHPTNDPLKTLIKEFANVDVSKQFQSSDFGGELSPSQLKYCANDVIYLHKIHDELQKILERENRIKLYQDCLKFLKIRVDLDLALFKDDIWSH